MVITSTNHNLEQNSYETMNSMSPEKHCFTSKEHLQVKEFLDSCFLPQYYEDFINEGFESLQAVLEVTEEDLIALNVKRGHRRVIQRGIATLKGVPKNQPLHLTASFLPPPSPPTSNFSRSKSNNGNHSSEGSSGTYTTSGYGSMSSPRHPTSLGNTQPSFEGNFRHHSFSQPQPSQSLSPASQLQSPTQHAIIMDDPMMKDSRSSFSSNDEEDDDEEEDEDTQQTDASRNNKTSSSSSSSRTSPLKRKYRRHPKPDKNAPIKPPSAYIMFSNDARAKLKDHSLTFVEIAKLVGDQWKNLSLNQKQAYERTAMRAKDKYIDALNAYRQTNEYKEYQQYLNNFKAEQDATNRKIARLRKRAKRDSPGSGSLADSSSNGNVHNKMTGSTESTDGFIERDTDNARSSSSSGSIDIYKVHRQNNAAATSGSSEESCIPRVDTTTPTIGASGTTESQSQSSFDEVMEDDNNGGECYSPQQNAPPLISDSMAKSNYHRLPFTDKPQSRN